MSIPRPKILTRVTVPPGGWGWDIDISLSTQFDTNVTGTVPAGDYYVSGDHQDDDLLYALVESLAPEIAAVYNVENNEFMDIHPTTHKVRLQFYGTDFQGTPDNNVRLNLDSWDADLCAALGFNNSAPVSSVGTDNPIFTADWHQGYGFYCDADSQGDIVPADRSMSFALQGKSISGKVKTQFFGESFSSALMLQFLERYEQGRTKVFSDGVGYGEASVWPYNRNEPLECWWQAARKGVEFRVYRDGYINASRAADRGVDTDASATTMTDTNKSWNVDPQRWAGRVLHFPTFPNGETLTHSWFIVSNTATVITVPNDDDRLDEPMNVDGLYPSGIGGVSYYLFDHPYKTYVVDLKKMSEFMPRERRSIDRWDITIPLLRYVS